MYLSVMGLMCYVMAKNNKCTIARVQHDVDGPYARQPHIINTNPVIIQISTVHQVFAGDVVI